MIYSDGSEESIKEYRKTHKPVIRTSPHNYTDEEKAERKSIILEIFETDKSIGMDYDPNLGFIRNKDGGYKVTEEAAFKTLDSCTLGQLRELQKGVRRVKEEAARKK